MRNPPTTTSVVLVLLPARANDGADISRGQVAALIHAADETTRFLACTIYARAGNLRDPVYVHSKIGIVDDRWLTVGSANLNAHSLFHDTEMNVVTLDPDVARATRVRLWSEHLELPLEEVEDDPIKLIDEHWERIASEQLELLENGQALTHRLVKLPGVSRAGGACSARCRAGSTTSDRRCRSVCADVLLGDLGGGLDRRAEHEEASTEGDRADAEPGPAEGETGDDVRHPVDAEEHATARDATAIATAPPARAARVRGALAREHERRAARRPRRDPSGRSGTTAPASPRSGRSPGARDRGAP